MISNSTSTNFPPVRIPQLSQNCGEKAKQGPTDLPVAGRPYGMRSIETKTKELRINK